MATKAQILRLAEIARELGMPVEKMGLSVDGKKITLLPPSAGDASDQDDELAAYRRRKHAHG